MSCAPSLDSGLPAAAAAGFAASAGLAASAGFAASAGLAGAAGAAAAGAVVAAGAAGAVVAAGAAGFDSAGFVAGAAGAHAASRLTPAMPNPTRRKPRRDTDPVLDMSPTLPVAERRHTWPSQTSEPHGLHRHAPKRYSA